MRCYQVSAKDGETVLAFRFAGTNALANDQKKEFVEELGINKKNVVVEQVDVPVGKEDLLVFLNELAAKLDAPEEEEES